MNFGAAKQGGATILLVLGGVLAAWALWAATTPHKPMRGR